MLLPALIATSLLTTPPQGTPPGVTALEPDGFFTDRPSYSPDDTLKIHGNWPEGSEFRYLIHRVGVLPNGTMVHTTPSVISGPQSPLPYGSYAEFELLDLSGMRKFTLEGWILPTFVPDGTESPPHSWKGIAGQQLWDGTQMTDRVGLSITHEGKLAALLRTDDASYRLESDDLLVEGEWQHVALTWDRATSLMTLHLTLSGETVDEDAREDNATGKFVAAGGVPIVFRLGARSEEDYGIEGRADPDGIMDGRLDSWNIWKEALDLAQLEHLRALGDDDLSAGSGPPYQPGPLFPPVYWRVRFEEDYAFTCPPSSEPCVLDLSGTLVKPEPEEPEVPLHGTIKGHGTPGLAGRPATGRALRVNHDQLVGLSDAQWPVSHEVALSSLGLSSGLYVLQAQEKIGSAFSNGGANANPDRYRCFVVRPADSAPPAEVALIVPVLTWTAYNSWPGGNSGAGNNSVYGRMADGRSIAHYQGWRRPNIHASAFPAESGGLSVHAPMARRVFEWLEPLTAGDWALEPEGVNWAALTYDVYTDWDLHEGRVGVDHDLVITMAHHEYWSDRMLTKLVAHMDDGGSAISLAGNQFAWRCEFDPATGVQEIKKWGTHYTSLGAADEEVFLSDGTTPTGSTISKAGYWRFIEAMSPLPGAGMGTYDPQRDRIFGTVNRLVVPCNPGEIGCFGRFQANPGHWLLNSFPGVGFNDSIVGHEADEYVPVMSTPLRWDATSSLSVLAEGVAFQSGVGVVNWEGHPTFALSGGTLQAELEQEARDENSVVLKFYDTASNCCDPPTPPDPPKPPSTAVRVKRCYPNACETDSLGHIVYYEHVGGGRVLNMATTAAPLALEPNASLQDDHDHLIEAALVSFLPGRFTPPPLMD